MLIETILDKILEIGETTANIVFSGYAESYRKMRGIPSPESYSKIDYEKLERRRFNSLFSKLHSEGFIKKSRSKNTNQAIWTLTKKGIEKLNFLKSRKDKTEKRNFYPRINANNQKDFLKIIIFDIPEIYSKKRCWLRRVLINLGFKKLQKSVWMGEEKLPQEFLDNLRELKLLSYIHIFAVSKKGSLNIN